MYKMKEIPLIKFLPSTQQSEWLKPLLSDLSRLIFQRSLLESEANILTTVQEVVCSCGCMRLCACIFTLFYVVLL